MSQHTSSRATGRSLRTVLLAALIAGIVLAVRAAVADKGGTYDPAETRR